MHQEIKVLIIEDEEIWMKSIATTLHDFGYTVSGIADNFEAAVELFNYADYDIALLDINLNSKNKGIELGRMMCTYYRKPFIFLTGSSDSHTLNDAINAGPSAYLTKPVHPAALIATLQSAINNFNNHTTYSEKEATTNNNIFFVKQGNKYKKIDWTKIVYLRSDKNYTIIFNEIDKNEYLIRSTLSKILNFIIPPHLKSSFVQVNRAEAVHIAYVQELAGEEVRTSHKTLTVTEVYSSNLKKALNVIM